jgi:hypothetical protein
VTDRSGDARYAACDGVAYREIEGQILILKADADVLQTLNATGAFIWKRLTKQQSVSRIAQGLATAFRIDRSRAEADVATFVADLKKQGLIRKLRS